MRYLSSLFLLLVAVVIGSAHPRDAVVRLTSHGGSGTIITSGGGFSLILSCAHCFEGGNSRTKPIVIDMPHPAPGEPKKADPKLIACGRSGDVDLSLIRIGIGPLPYVTEVAGLEYRGGGECWSVGYDELKWPAQCRPAKIVGDMGPNIVTTDTSPYHGRSGGGLILKSSGKLVGVVSAYQAPNGYNALQAYRNGTHETRSPRYLGMYVSHGAIVKFLMRAGVLKGQDFSAPPPPVQRFDQQRQPQQFQLPQQPRRGGG